MSIFRLSLDGIGLSPFEIINTENEKKYAIHPHFSISEG